MRILTNTSTRLRLRTPNGTQLTQVDAIVTRNGGCHGSPYDVDVRDIAVLAFDGYSVIAHETRESLERDLERNGRSWSWLEERLIDAFVESEAA